MYVISLTMMNNPGRKQCVQEIRPTLMYAQLIIIQKTPKQEKDEPDFIQVLQRRCPLTDRWNSSSTRPIIVLGDSDLSHISETDLSVKNVDM